MGFFTMKEANLLRRVCEEMRVAVAGAAWCDGETHIAGSLASWRKCFPKALAANLEGRLDLCNEDFAHLKGISNLNMSWCTQITDAAFST